MLAGNKHKIAYYYSAGAFVLLLFLKFLSSNFFRDFIDLSLNFLPLIIILAVAISAYLQYRKSSGDEIQRMAIRHYALVEMLILLFITLLFYILYSPGSFSPIVEALGKISRQVSLENYFFTILCLSLATIVFGVAFIFFRLYQKSQGTYNGSMGELVKKDLYAMFFVIVFLFFSSVLTYPKAYAPITDTIGMIFGNIFFPQNDDRTFMERLTNTRIDSLKSAFSKTYGSISKNVGDTSTKLTTSIVDTKDALSGTITRTNKDLKSTLSKDIKDKLDVSGGSLEGDLTIEDDLTVEGTTYLMDTIPDSDDTYDLGSVSKGWNNVYIHRLYGSSILTIGDLNTSHGLSGTSDLLVSGDLEVKGDIYFDGALDMGAYKITNLADPVDAQDAVTKAYYAANTPAGVFSRAGTTLSPTTSGDKLDMLAAVIENIGANTTDFNSNGGLTIATTGVLNAQGTSAHYLGPITFTNGAIAGVTGITITGSGNITGLPATPSGDTAAASKAYVDAQDSATGYQNGSAVDLNMANTGLVLNIGSASTDFTSGGGLNLAGVLAASSASAHSLGPITFTNGAIASVTTLNTGQGAYELYAMNQDVTTTSAPTFATVNTGQGAYELYAMNQDVTTTSAPTFATVNTGQGANELYDMNQDVQTSDAVTFATVNTGQGAYELYAMDQNVRTSDSPTFAAATIATLIGGTATTSDLILKTTTGVAASGADMLFQTGSNGLTEAMKIDYQGITYVNSLQSGAQAFPDDAGVTQWVDLNMTTAITTAGTVESYSAMLDGTAVLTIYGTADGSGGVTAGSTGVGIGTAAPSALLDTTFASTSTTGASQTGNEFNITDTGIVTTGTDTTLGLDLNVTRTGATGGTINTFGIDLDATADNAGAGTSTLTGLDVTVSGADTNYAALFSGGNVGINDATPDGLLDVEPTGAVTAASYGINLSNLTTNATTDGINKYGAYITSTGTWTGSTGTATNNYGLYINTTADADNNYDIYAASGANLTTAGTWTNAPSYRRYKDKAGDATGYLDKLMALDIDEWQYKNSEIDGMNRFKADPNRHASPYLDDFYNVFGLGTDKGVNTQDLAGVALASVKELNARFINENNQTDADVADITLKTDENATTIEGLQKSVDENLILIESRIKSQETSVDDLDSQVADYESRIASLETVSKALQTQIADLQAKTNTELNVAQIDANTTDVAFLKTLLGVERVKNPEDVDILGKISSETTETGALVIKIADEEAPTIGEGKISEVVKDEDKDGIDDDTKSDGKSVVIDTEAVTDNSKIFVTPKSTTADPLAVTKIKDGESFTVEVANPVLENLKFDWWIIETK